MVSEGDWPWENFTPKEMADRESYALSIDSEFMDILQHLRSSLDKALPVSSAYRTERHNTLIRGGPAHPAGKAADIRIFGEYAYEVVGAAMMLGFTGIGVKQTGRYGARFIHLDILEDGESGVHRPRIWSY